MKHVSYAFSHSTPNLQTGGAIAYVPAVGDRIVDYWIEITAAWNGTTPTLDVGLFLAGRTGLGASGGFGSNVTPVDLSSLSVDADEFGTGMVDLDHGVRFVVDAATVLRFVTADPFCVCVSQDGTPSGADPASTTGRAEVHLLIVPAE